MSKLITSSLHWLQPRSKTENDKSFQKILFSDFFIHLPNVGKTDSTKIKSLDLVVNKSQLDGSKYYTIDEDPYPT